MRGGERKIVTLLDYIIGVCRPRDVRMRVSMHEVPGHDTSMLIPHAWQATYVSVAKLFNVNQSMPKCCFRGYIHMTKRDWSFV